MQREQDNELLISVVIPTKNRKELLSISVATVLKALPAAQTEVIVVDDHSDVPAQEYLKFSDARLRVITNGGSKGAGGARNFGVQHARGNTIMFLDDDDVMLQGYPEWVLSQSADYGFSATTSFAENGVVSDLPRIQTGGIAQIKNIRPFRKQISGLGCGFWIKKDAFVKIGGISEVLQVNEDTDFSIRLMAEGYEGIKSLGVGVWVRKHAAVAGQQPHLTYSKTARQRAQYFGEIIERNLSWLKTRPDAMMFLRKRQVKMLVRGGEMSCAWQACKSLAGAQRAALVAYLCSEYLGRFLLERKA